MNAAVPVRYDDRDETGRFYRLDEAQPGWLISECAGGAMWPSGDLRIGVITAVRGGGFEYATGGRTRFVPDRRVYAVARPVFPGGPDSAAPDPQPALAGDNPRNEESCE